MARKQKIGLVAGEDIDMPQDFIDANGITLYQYSLAWEGITKVRKELYKKMRELRTQSLNESPRTSQPSVGQFKELFTKSLDKYEDILVLCISSRLSGTYNSAQQAIDLLPKQQKSHVHLIESYSATGYSALMIREILNLLKKGRSISEIKKRMQSFQEGINLVGMIEDSYWLQKGGRISLATSMIINQMKKIGVRPLLGAKDGKIALLKVRMNAKDKSTAICNYINSIVLNEKIEAIITYTDNKEDAASLKKQLKALKPNINVLYMHEMTPVLGAHLGPDSIMISWRSVEN